jgi:PAS domain S-box-containing protein
MVASPARHLDRVGRTYVAFGSFIGILVLQFVLPDKQLEYAQIVPLLFLTRAYGRRTGMSLAILLAPALQFYESIGRPSMRAADFSTDAFVLATFLVTVVFLVDRYDELLERSHRSSVERQLVRASEETFRELAENLPHFVWTQRPGGRIDYANARWFEFTGLPPAAGISDLDLARVVLPDDLIRERDHVKEAIAAEAEYALEFRAKPDGAPATGYRWFFARVVPVRDGEKRLVKWIGSATDIHDRKTAELARERDLAAIEAAIPHLVWRARPDGSGEYFSGSWLRYTGLSAEQSQREGLFAAIHPEDRVRVRTMWLRSLRGGAVFDVEFRMRRHDGAYRWFLTRATPLRDDAGAIVRWFGTCTDVDAQKTAQRELERQFELAHRVSDAFQHASLPAVLPEVPGLRFSAVYEAGRREASVGGDWYDALRLLDGRIMLSIGDVAGSGLGAAVTMSAVRQAIRGAAQIHAEPLAVLEAADRTLREESSDRIVTAFVGVFDPITHALDYACAGHPPPLHRRPDGSVEELAAEGLPLGVRRKGDSQANSTMLTPGSALVLYTDGLIESTHDLVAGQASLAQTVAALDRRDPRPAESIRGSVLSGGAHDDVAILVMSVCEPADAPGFRRWTFDVADRDRAREAQAGLRRTLAFGGATADEINDAELIFAELLGNVVRHAGGPVEIVLDTCGRFPVLSVLDRGPGFRTSRLSAPDTLSESGRGLFIVRSLAVDLNARHRPGGGTHLRAVLYTDDFRTRPARQAPLLATA